LTDHARANGEHIADEPAPYPIPGITDLRSFAEALIAGAVVQIAEDRARAAERLSRG
jgi:hypothetical protein